MEKDSGAAKSGRASTPQRAPVKAAADPLTPQLASMLQLQRSAGNGAVSRLLRRPGLPTQHPDGVSAPTVTPESSKTVSFVELRTDPSGPAGTTSAEGGAGVVQRAPVKTIPALGWGGSSDGSFTFNPHADIMIGTSQQGRWFQTSASEEVEVAPNTRGTVVIHNPFYWVYHEVTTTAGMLSPTTTDTRSFGGPVEASITATFSVDKDGKVVIGPPLKSGIVGFPAVLDGSIDSVKQDGQDEGSVNISTVLKSTKAVSTGSTTGNAVTTGGDVKPLGVGVSGSTQASVANSWGVTTSGSGTWMGTFGVVFRVKRKPPTVVKARIGYNQEGRFLSGDAGIDGVNAWWGSLPEPVRTQIKLGKKSVFLYGNASKTGSSTRNQAVVANRLKDVRGKLVALTERMDIVPENTGAIADERSVVIEVRYTEDEASATP